MTATMTFGEWMRSTRERKRYGVVDCARQAKMPASQWSRMEADEPKRQDGSVPQPKRETVEKIALALEVPLSEALEVAYPPSSETSFPDGLPPLMQEDMDKVIEYARFLYSQRENATAP